MADMTLVRTSADAAEIDWSRADERAIGEKTGVDPASQAFWIRLSDLDFVSLTEMALRGLEAHGWETNLENVLYAIETMTIGRMARLRDGKDGDKSRAVSYERVVSLMLPRKGQSGNLLSMLYALVSGSEAPAPPRTPEDINDHPAVKALQARIAFQESQLALMRAKELGASKKREEVAAVVDDAARGVSGLSAELGIVTLQARSVDSVNQVVAFRAERRSYELSFDSLTHIPEAGASAIGLTEGAALKGVIPFGLGWHEISYVHGRILAHASGRIKVALPGRTEWVVPASGASAAQRSLRRHDEVVVAVASGRVVRICARPQAQDLLALERRLRLGALESGEQLMRIREIEESSPDSVGGATEAFPNNNRGVPPSKRRVG